PSASVAKTGVGASIPGSGDRKRLRGYATVYRELLHSEGGITMALPAIVCSVWASAGYGTNRSFAAAASVCGNIGGLPLPARDNVGTNGCCAPVENAHRAWRWIRFRMHRVFGLPGERKNDLRSGHRQLTAACAVRLGDANIGVERGGHPTGSRLR